MGRNAYLTPAQVRQPIILLDNVNLQNTPARGRRKQPLFASTAAMVEALRPQDPVTVLRPHAVTKAARWFVQQFPGKVMYSVKSNPDVKVIGLLAKAGVEHFDTASLAEIDLVHKLLPQARLYYMHPVKSREAIAKAYFHYGIRDFSLDSHDELKKILEVTNNANDLSLYVRLAMPNDKAAYSLSGKFGVPLEQASSLVVATRKAANKLGLCFHVGSQCMQPQSYSHAIQMVADLLEQTKVQLDVLDVGGGFPSIYPDMTPPELGLYMAEIKQAVASHPALASCEMFCEPGRAMVAESGSVVVRVDLRKGNMLYINDGTYGSLFDAGSPAWRFPVKAFRPDGKMNSKLQPFGFFGPTCDSIDVMKGPFMLPSDIREGDWIEVGQLGAYGATLRTRFNGFYSDAVAEVADAPLMSLYSNE